jgi:DNA-directed RNA polymerase subunit M/transcription elongation factor TFIIS
MSFNYKCPKCNSIMICVSTASIPQTIHYQCYSCGYTSKPIKGEYHCEVLPVELRGEE